MTYRETVQQRVEGELQLALVDAWREVDRALSIAKTVEFGSTELRREFVVKLQALRGCVLLAAGRLIDLASIEAGVGGIAQSRASRVKGQSTLLTAAEVKRFALMCPMGFPEMRFGLGKLAGWVARGEAELVHFFGVAPPAERRGGFSEAARAAERLRRQRVREALAESDARLQACSDRLQEREASVLREAAEMRRRSGVQ